MRVIQSWMNVRVASKKLEAKDIFSFELVDLDGAQLPPFTAGAHIDVEVSPGLVRQYSLCNRPDDRRAYRIAVLRDAGSRGGSIAMADQVQAKHLLRISEPRNHFPLEAAARHSILIAGGIGITPIMCMAERLANTGGDFDLHYCSRSQQRMAFFDHLARSDFSHRVHFHFDDGPIDQRIDLDTALGAPQEGTHIYTCGPAGLIEAVLNRSTELGWASANVHREFFGVAGGDGGSAGESFSVRIASTGMTYEIPADVSVADTLFNAGVDIPMSCSQGVCGTCVTRVLEGEPDHRDVYLTDEEHARNDQFTPCCSRSKSPLLVLDL